MDRIFEEKSKTNTALKTTPINGRTSTGTPFILLPTTLRIKSIENEVTKNSINRIFINYGIFSKTCYNIGYVMNNYKVKIMAVTINARHFDALAFVKKSKELGASEQLAEYQARQIEQAIDIAVSTAKASTQSEVSLIKAEIDNKELATKGDVLLMRGELRETELRLQKEIVQSNNKTLLWMFGMMSGFAVFMFGVMAKGFHWW